MYERSGKPIATVKHRSYHLKHQFQGQDLYTEYTRTFDKICLLVLIGIL